MSFNYNNTEIAALDEKITNLEFHIEIFAETLENINQTKLINNNVQEVYIVFFLFKK